jgi:hypothetical protein
MGGELTRAVSAQQFVLEYAPDLPNLFCDPVAAFAELEAEGHEEAQRVGHPRSLEGTYPVAIWHLAWARHGIAL